MNEWFSYQTKVVEDYLTIIYYNCKLNKRIGTHSIGEEIPAITIDYGKRQLRLTLVGASELYSISLRVNENK